MLKLEDDNYTDSLKASLREDEDYSHYIDGISDSIYGIYGDRNNSDQTFLIDSLNLKDCYLSRIQLSFVHNSCHLPMLENPKELTQIIQSILRQN